MKKKPVTEVKDLRGELDELISSIDKSTREQLVERRVESWLFETIKLAANKKKKKNEKEKQKRDEMAFNIFRSRHLNLSKLMRSLSKRKTKKKKIHQRIILRRA